MISSSEIKAFAREQGFDGVGIVEAHGMEEAEKTFREWIEAGFHGEMKYLEAYQQRLKRLRSTIPDVKSIIVLGVNYFNSRSEALPEVAGKGKIFSGRIARYAWGRDYHAVIRNRLERIEDFIRQKVPRAQLLSCVDTQPVFERSYAEKAGLGFRGKQTNLLSKDFGPWLFLSEILTDLELASDSFQNHGSCGTCSSCIEICPTGAIVSDGKIDARRCIAYLTIEYKGVIPREIRPLIKDWVFGCDECLTVCPFTRFSKETTWEDLKPRSGSGSWLSLLSLFEIKTNGQYKKRFEGTAILRATRKMMLRNAAVVLGNVGDETAVPVLAKALQEEPVLVRIHAAWALGRIGGERALEALRHKLTQEENAEVREEILLALENIPVGSKRIVPLSN